MTKISRGKQGGQSWFKGSPDRILKKPPPIVFTMGGGFLAGGQGFEPQLSHPECDVLPIKLSPIGASYKIQIGNRLTSVRSTLSVTQHCAV